MIKNILAFDTTSGLSAAVLCDGKILAKNSIDESGKQSEMLVSLIEKTLAETKISYQNLSAIAVTKGPGSFTSTRIGIVTAQTMKLALEIPLIAMTANEVLAFMNYQKNKNEKISTAIDAGMNEFFCADFIFENALPQMVGDIVLKAVEGIGELIKGKISAEFVGLLAFEKIQKGGNVLEDDNALYLRAPRIG